MITFEFKEFEIIAVNNILFASVMCEVDLSILEPALPEIKPTLNDPGEPSWEAVWQIDEIRLISDNKSLSLTETEFVTFFAGAQDVVNNALEWASEQEED